MSNFAEQLRLISELAQVEQINKMSADEEMKAIERIMDIGWAASKIRKIQGQAEVAAQQGKRKLRVGKIQIYDGHGGRYLNIGNGRPKKLSCEQLLGRWRALYEQCNAIGLKVNVIWTNDGVGVSDWYEFWVEW
jgi:hypothetical protein